MTKQNEIKIFPSANDLFRFAANDFANRAISIVNDKGIFSVVLAGGNTPKLFFDRLAEVASFKSSIPWEKIQFFFGDERYVAFDDVKSNYHMAAEHLFSKVPVNPNNIYRIPTEFNDPKEAAKHYEKTLRQVFHIEDNTLPPFDLIYLGLGADAHTASLMPFSDPVKDSIDNPLAEKNTQLVASLFVPTVNGYRITLTPAAINSGLNIIFLVTGADKAMATADVLEGKTDPLQYPAQLIHSVDGKTLWYLDQSAAGKLSSMLNMKKAVFLDSDGVLNKAIINKDGNPVAPTTLAELVIPEEVKPALDKLKQAGYLLICVTNKPDIDRGLMTQEQVDKIYHKMRKALPLDDVCICYHENSDCYKPKPGLIFDAAKKHNIDLTQSYMIGDRWRDIGAGQNAGCKTIWIDRQYAEKKPFPPADYTAYSLSDATQWILTS